MTKVILTAVARTDLREIQHYIATVLMNSGASKGMLKRITAQLRMLERFPESGTPILPRESSVVYHYWCAEAIWLFTTSSGILQWLTVFCTARETTWRSSLEISLTKKQNELIRVRPLNAPVFLTFLTQIVKEAMY